MPYIANALAREIRETDALKLRLVEARKTENALRARVAELEEAIRIALANLEDDPNYPVTINTLELALKP